MGQVMMMDVLIDRYKDPLYNFCLHLCKARGAADDLFQDTWVRVLANIRSFDLERPFKTWLFTIAANLYKDRWRRHKRWLGILAPRESHPGEEQIAALAADIPAPCQALMNHEEAVELHNSLERLGNNLRIPIILFYLQELSIQEIAEVLNIPPGTVKSRLHSARGKLKTMLEVE